jgi:hypothetical protein
MLELSVVQGSVSNFVLAAVNRGGGTPTGFLLSDALSSSVWAGQTQAPLFSPAASWFTGLSSVTLTGGGSSYSSTPTVTVTGGGAGVTVPATITPVVVGGVITELLLTDQGSGYTATPTVTITDGTGSGATATATPALGWLAGLVAVEISNAQALLLTDANAAYHLNVTVSRTSGAGTQSAEIIEVLLKVLYAPGAGTQVTPTYCSYADVLRYAPWLSMVQDQDSDQEGYYTQRLEATQWLNWLIVRSWRGTSAAYFGDAGRSAQYWLGAWVRRTPLPSYWLNNQLSGGIVRQPITVTAAGSGYSVANVTFSGGGAPAAGTATASAVVSGGQVISISLMSAGYGYTSTPTITITGDGTGATATCSISASVLILRPQVVRVVALKAASIVGLGQIGRQHTIAHYGAMFRDLAATEAVSIVAELDLNGDGIADLPIPLNVTNTMFT